MININKDDLCQIRKEKLKFPMVESRKLAGHDIWKTNTCRMFLAAPSISNLFIRTEHRSHACKKEEEEYDHASPSVRSGLTERCERSV